MKTNKRNLALSVIALAVQTALVLMTSASSVALAEDDEVSALTRPTNHIELGGAYTPSSSYKSGEYTGLGVDSVRQNWVLNPLGAFSIRGGNAYGMDPGTLRWSLTGTDIGLTSQAVGASVSDQGFWNLGVTYDELRHYGTDSYQTPLQGANGGNVFTLPSGFGLINTGIRTNGGANCSGVTTTSATYLYSGSQCLTSTQLGYFHTQDVSTDRKNTGFTAGLNLNQQWGMQVEYNHLNQTGAKLISTATNAYSNGVPAIYSVNGSGASAYAYTSVSQGLQMIMNPTNYVTDNVNATVNWKGEKGHFSMGYYGSFFHDAYNSVSFPNPFVSTSTTPTNTATAYNTPAQGSALAYPIDALSTAPDNQLHQFNFTGGYNLDSKTKLSGGFSRSRNTQNDTYVNQDQMGANQLGLPVNSLNGVVITTHGDLKLTQQASSDLTLTATAKYNERDNRTSSNAYGFNVLGGTYVVAPNMPLSTRKTQVELAADYKIDSRQKVNVSLEREQVRRWCNTSLWQQYAAVNSGTITSGYYGKTISNCVQVPESDENRLNLGYKFKANEDLTTTAGFTYARRNASPLGSTNYYNPFGDNNAYNAAGFVAFFDASRTEYVAKAGLNWQANSQLSYTANVRYARDNYDSLYGVNNGEIWSLNLDANYALSEKTSVTAYYTVQRKQRDLFSASSTAALTGTTSGTWFNRLNDYDDTIGLGARHGGLMAGKLNVAADLTLSIANSGYNTMLNYTCTASGTAGANCGNIPDINSKLMQMKLTGDYLIDKTSKIKAGYVYSHLTSNDWYYNAYQYGYTPTTLMPTNQLSPGYSTSTVYVLYDYSFR